MDSEQATITEHRETQYVFDFEKMAKWIGHKPLIDEYRGIYDICEHGRLVSDSRDLFELIPACLRFECHKMWARFYDPQSGGKWCDDNSNFIHFGVSDDFASGKPIMFYYKVTNSDGNPFSGPSVKYHIFSVSMMVAVPSSYTYGYVPAHIRPLKPDPLAVTRRVRDYLLCHAIFALDEPDCEEIAIHGEEIRGKRRPIPGFYRVY